MCERPRAVDGQVHSPELEKCIVVQRDRGRPGKRLASRPDRWEVLSLAHGKARWQQWHSASHGDTER